jgi:S1-C subfamily serine protease
MLLVQVESGGPAEKSGLLLGDTLLAVNGQPLEDVDDLRARLRNFHAGQEVSLRILRGGQLLDLRVTLGVQE